MTHRRIRALTACLLVFLVVQAVFAMPASASPVDSQIQQKEAERQAALAEVARLQEQLEQQIQDYLGLVARIDQARRDVTDAQGRVAQAEADLQRARDAFNARAAELYRSGRVDYLEVLLSADSVPDLFKRIDYLFFVTRYDTRVVEDLTVAKRQRAFEQREYEDRVARLEQMRVEAEARRKAIEQSIQDQQTRAAALGEDIAELMRRKAAEAARGGTPGRDFAPDTVISDANFRDATCMSVSDVQAFLEGLSSTLATYRGPDYAGRQKTAAEMIVEAAIGWNVSPKVILVTLQKEQSLLEDRSPSRYAYDWAMGCGKMDGSTLTQYKGFGNQIWYGARALDRNADGWYPGVSLVIDGSPVFPTNASTYSLYRYTPHLHGNTSFWMLYWRYFGDPVS
jgi:peptidoglycan hydrolase CwlO-like protein